MLQKFIARQLAHPSGLCGRMFTARWLNKANAGMNQLMLERLAIKPEDRLLEVGFGGGDLLERILSTRQSEFVAGVDLSTDMVRLARRRLQSYIETGKAEVRCGDIEALPYRDGEFTKLCSVNTLYFWRNPALALLECRRVLRPGGQILLCFNSRDDRNHGQYINTDFGCTKLRRLRISCESPDSGISRWLAPETQNRDCFIALVDSSTGRASE